MTESLANIEPTTITDAALSDLVFTLLEPHGFSQFENRFVKHTDETDLLITLQKSCCSSVHNLNLAVVINQLLGPDALDETPAWGHLQTRLCILAENDLMLALDSMEPMTTGARRDIIAEAWSEHGLPWLLKLGTLDGIRTAIKAGEINPKHHPLGSEDYAFLL